MRILVTGREGQVARALAERGAGRHELVFAGRPELDLAVPELIDAAVARHAPEMIFSVGAYTAVDRAEDEPELAMAINGTGPGQLARAAARIGAPIIHLSTDYVFDGALDRPYREADPVGPINVYGTSKLEGERALARAGGDFAILRTSWVYSPFGANFVRTMLRLAESHDEVRVVADQLGCPTSAFDIAEALLRVADCWSDPGTPRVGGVFHFAGAEACSWAAFAETIFAASARHGGRSPRTVGISTAEWPTRARRPANSQLDSSRFSETFGYRAGNLAQSLEPVIERLLG